MRETPYHHNGALEMERGMVKQDVLAAQAGGGVRDSGRAAIPRNHLKQEQLGNHQQKEHIRTLLILLAPILISLLEEIGDIGR